MPNSITDYHAITASVYGGMALIYKTFLRVLEGETLLAERQPFLSKNLIEGRHQSVEKERVGSTYLYAELFSVQS